MAASCFCCIVVFVAILVICAESEDVQVNEVQGKRFQNNDLMDAPLQIQDTAKKKIISHNDNFHNFLSKPYHHLRSHIEVPAKPPLGLKTFYISKQRMIRKRRQAIQELQNVNEESPLQKSEYNSEHMAEFNKVSKTTTSSTVLPTNLRTPKPVVSNIRTTPAVVSSSLHPLISGITSLLNNTKNRNSSNISGIKHNINGAIHNVSNNGTVLSSTTIQPTCVNRTEVVQIRVIKRVNSEDATWAAVSLGVLLFMLFTVVWFSKMWRKTAEFYELYGAAATREGAAETSTEMAWSKHGYTPTVSLKEIVETNKQFFQSLQQKVKEKFTNNNDRHSSFGRKHTAKYTKLLTLPNDMDQSSDEGEQVLYKRL